MNVVVCVRKRSNTSTIPKEYGCQFRDIAQIFSNVSGKDFAAVLGANGHNLGRVWWLGVDDGVFYGPGRVFRGTCACVWCAAARQTSEKSRVVLPRTPAMNTR